ncbi:MAG: hypothetical protein ABR886_01060 [Dehalococcoidales bacterium]|jgi:hypothetical protein
MAMESIIGRPISLELDLSILSDRVINTISRKGNFTREDRVIFQKAVDFLENVQKGGDAVNRLELNAATGEEIESFGLANQTYEVLGKGRRLKEQSERIKVLSKLISVAKQLSQDTSIPAEKDVKELYEFFRSAKEITNRLTAGEIDQVKIG